MNEAPSDRHAGTPKQLRSGAPVHPDRPFVGNETVDDNLREAVEITAWNAIGSAKCHLSFDVHAHIVTIRGELASEQQRQALEGAVRHVTGVHSIINATKLRAEPADTAGPAAEPQAAPETIDVEPRSIAYVTRFCSFDEASLSAAIRDAIGLLDRTFEAQGLPRSNELLVEYINHRGDTVTLRIGMPSVQLSETSHVHVGTAPAGRMAATNIAAGPEAIVEGYSALLRAIGDGALYPTDHYWQRFDVAEFRPWAGHPASQLFLPVTARTSL